VNGQRNTRTHGSILRRRCFFVPRSSALPRIHSTSTEDELLTAVWSSDWSGNAVHVGGTKVVDERFRTGYVRDFRTHVRHALMDVIRRQKREAVQHATEVSDVFAVAVLLRQTKLLHLLQTWCQAVTHFREKPINENEERTNNVCEGWNHTFACYVRHIIPVFCAYTVQARNITYCAVVRFLLSTCKIAT